MSKIKLFFVLLTIVSLFSCKKSDDNARPSGTVFVTTSPAVYPEDCSQYTDSATRAACEEAKAVYEMLSLDLLVEGEGIKLPIEVSIWSFRLNEDDKPDTTVTVSTLPTTIKGIFSFGSFQYAAVKDAEGWWIPVELNGVAMDLPSTNTVVFEVWSKIDTITWCAEQYYSWIATDSTLVISSLQSDDELPPYLVIPDKCGHIGTNYFATTKAVKKYQINDIGNCDGNKIINSIYELETVV